jgi:hypothetical protein
MVRTVRDPIFWLTYCFEWKQGVAPKPRSWGGAITPIMDWLHNPDHEMAP